MKITLRIWSNKYDGNVISRRLELNPNKSYNIGDNFILKGRTIKRTHNYLEYSISQYVKNDQYFEEQILFLLKILEDKNEFFKILKNDNESDIAINFFCTTDADELDSGISSLHLKIIANSVNWISFGL